MNGHVRLLITIVALALITYLVIAGTIAENLNFTSIALALVGMVGFMWGIPPRGGDK